MKRSLEAWLQISGTPQPLQLCRRGCVRPCLKISVKQIFDRMGKLVPDKFAMVPRGKFQRRIRRQQVSPNNPVPIAQAGIDVGWHMQRVWIARGDSFVL